LKLSKNIAELREEELLVRKLSMWRKFPQLEHFSISLNQVEDLRMIRSIVEVLAVHSIYISLHRFLVTSARSIKEFSGDFSNICVIGFPCYLRNVPEYSRVKEALQSGGVELSGVTIRMNEMEGEDFWDLSE
jgi:hypothetical protein